MTIECPQCQHKNPKDTLYCGKCGTKLPEAEKIPVSPTKTIETPKEELKRGSTFAKFFDDLVPSGKGASSLQQDLLSRDRSQLVLQDS